MTGISNIPTANWDLTCRVKRGKVESEWVWFTNAGDINSTGAWTDIDVSSSVPGGTTGVVVENGWGRAPVPTPPSK